MIISMLCGSIFVMLVVWYLLQRVGRLMIHMPTAISIFVCLSMVQLMAVFISMRCTLCVHFLEVALTLNLVDGYAISFFFQAEDGIRLVAVTGVQTCALPICGMNASLRQKTAGQLDALADPADIDAVLLTCSTLGPAVADCRSGKVWRADGMLARKVAA